LEICYESTFISQIPFLSFYYYAECGYVTVCNLSVRLSVCHIQVCVPHRLEYFENNFMAKQLEAPAHIDPKMGDLVQWEHPKIRVE